MNRPLSAVLITCCAVTIAALPSHAESRAVPVPTEIEITITVPDDVGTIQGAIDLANAGDTVLVRPGLYPESLLINKAVAVQSLSGSSQTTLDVASTSTAAVRVTVNGVTLDGFTIDGGSFGLDVHGSVTSIVVQDCILQDSASRHLRIPPSVVNTCMAGTSLVPHASGSNNGIQLLAGAVVESATWPTPPTDFAYFMDDVNDYIDVAGPTSPTLTLSPGTVFKFRVDCGIVVGTGAGPGALVADDVIFTSYRDDSAAGDTYGDGATTGAPDQWDRVQISSNGDATFTNCEFRYGGRANYGMILTQNASPTITGCTFLRSGSAGIRCQNTSAPTITGSTFTGNLWALQLENSTTANLISGNTFDPQTYRHVVVVPNCVEPLVNNNTFVANPAGTNNAIQISAGTLSESVTWPTPPTDFAYFMDDVNDYIDVGGPTSPTLTLSPGTVFKFRVDCGIVVGTGAGPGALVADDVIFTSYRDDSAAGDTYGDGATTGAPDQWDRVQISSNGDATFTNCEFRYGGRANYGMILTQNASPTITGCTFLRSGSAGIRCQNTSAPTITGSTFTGNLWALQLENSTTANLISGNTFDPQTYRHVVVVPNCVEPLVNNNTFVANPAGTNNAIQISAGTLSESATWPTPPTDFAYFMDDVNDYIDVAGPTSPTLTLSPGTVFKFRVDCGIVVGTGAGPGALVADDVIFTSYRDDSAAGDTYGDGATTGAPDQWDRVQISSNGDATFTNCEFRYGGRANYGMILTQNASPTITGCTFLRSGSAGIRCQNTSAPTITGSTFTGNLWALQLENSTTANLISGNTFDPQTYRHVVVVPNCVEPLVNNNTFVANPAGTNNAIQIFAGTLSESATWPTPPTDFAYCMDDVNDYIRVVGPSNPTLTLLPGTVFKFRGDCGILMGTSSESGNLVADGVLFTSYRDDSVGGDTYGDGAIAAAPNNWDRIGFNANGDGTFTNCEFRYGGKAGTGMVYCIDSSPTIIGCTFTQSGSPGIRCRNTSAPTITGSTFTGNLYALQLENSTTANLISGNTFEPQTRRHVVVTPVCVEPLVNNNTFVANPAGTNNAIQIFAGTLSESVTWPTPPTDFAYCMDDVNDYIRVVGPSNPTLTLLPGTVFKFRGDCGILMGTSSESGNLVADGVLFTSYRDDSVGGDTYGDGAIAAAPNNWDRIGFNANGDGTFTNCEFRYGGKAGTGMVYCIDSSPTIIGCTFTQSGSPGIRCRNTSAPTITGSTFTGNLYALQLENSTTANLISGNTFEPQTRRHVVVTPVCVEPLVNNNTFVANPAGTNNAIQIFAGTLSESVTWPTPPTDFAYFMDDVNDYIDVAGPTSPTLTLSPGTVFKFRGDCGILMGTSSESGNLVADGVLFTSYRDDSVGGDTYGDGAIAAAPNNWDRIGFNANGDGTFTNCEFRYGGKAGTGMVYCIDSSPTFTNCSFRSSGNSGMRVRQGGEPRVVDSLFEGNQVGIRLLSNARPQVLNSCFTGNTSYGVRADAYTDDRGRLPVLNCWWGDPSGPGDPYPGAGDAVTNNVVADPWMDYPICEGVTDVPGPGQLPSAFVAHDPAPNPFNPRTMIAFDLPRSETVSLRIYDLRGRVVRNLLTGDWRDAGEHSVIWDGTDASGRAVASGVYVYELRAGVFQAIRKMTLMK